MQLKGNVLSQNGRVILLNASNRQRQPPVDPGASKRVHLGLVLPGQLYGGVQPRGAGPDQSALSDEAWWSGSMP